MSQTKWRRRGFFLIVVRVVLAGTLCLGAAGALALLSGCGGSGNYTVRAIFDDAANIIPGEVVKIEGVKVGTVGSVTPTPEQKAAVVLNITTAGFQDFRADASCTIEPQALIGEKFVNCLPTQPRPEGTPLPPPLHKIGSGHEGEGQYLLPVTNTSSPVDVDQLQDINRLPVQQRFTIIINELGAGLAGRGADLNAVIRRADPALRELDKVLGILAGQNKVLVSLAEDSDRALAPVPRVKDQITGFVVGADTVARASANQRGAIARNLAGFPPFLEQLGPAMERFGRLADQTIPTFTDLKAAAPGINQMFENLGPFSSSTTAFLRSLGANAKVTGPALVALQPLLAQVKTTGAAAKPFSASLAELFTSLRDTGGLERLMDFIFLGTSSANGYDALGHFLRTEGVAAATCLTYAIAPQGGCTGKLFNTNGVTGSGEGGAEGGAASVHANAAKALAASSSTGLVMKRTLAVLDGATPAQAVAKYPGATSATSAASPSLTAAGEGSASVPQPVGGSSAGTTYYTPSAEGSSAGGMLLNYLLGN